MKLLFNPVSLGHDTGLHPENRRRLDAFKNLPIIEYVPDESILNLVHTPTHIHHVKQNCQISRQMNADTLTSPHSFDAALAAANLTVLAARNKDFALVRPPGHHAYPNRSTGFCLFNNIAIAATQLNREGKKVLILDFDGHLGDGTSRIFYLSKQVMYWSMHQFPAFPGHGFVNEIGAEEGEGFNINIPLPPGTGDDIVMHAFEHFLPIAEKFEPDIVAISAGFDSHKYDVLLQLNFSINSFYRIGKIISQTFPDVFATLEGGYNIDILPKAVYNFVAGINGEIQPFHEEETLSGLRVWEEYEANANAALGILKKYWN